MLVQGGYVKVLHVHSGNLFGGIETGLISNVRLGALAPTLQHSFALCFPGRLETELRATGATVHDLGGVRVSRPWTVARARRRLAAVLDAHRPDLVVTHSPWSHAIFAPVMRRAGLPLVFWLHGIPTGKHWLERWAARTPPVLVLCNSRFTRSAAPRLFPGVRAETLYFAMNPPAPAVDAEVREKLRASFGARPEQCVIVMVSRLEPMKGHRVLLDALGKLRERGEWTCWIVGGAQRASEERYRRGLGRWAAKLGLDSRVRFLGERNDVRAILHAADLFCHPNIAPEAFGRVFVEALGEGLPTVGTAVGATLEIVDESCGVLVRPGDADGLASSLADLLDHPERRKALGANGGIRARVLCDPAVRLAELAALLGTVRPTVESL